MLSEDLAPDPLSISTSISTFLQNNQIIGETVWKAGNNDGKSAAHDPNNQVTGLRFLRRSLVPLHETIITQINHLEGAPFAIQLRKDLLGFISDEREAIRQLRSSSMTPSLSDKSNESVERHRALKRLEEFEWNLQNLLGSWFDGDTLHLRSLKWNETPVALIERIMRYESVHPICDLKEMKRRLGKNRRCFGFFHPRLPNEPLVFIEVALLSHLPQDIHSILQKDDLSENERQEELDPDKELWHFDEQAARSSPNQIQCTHAIFYSINSPHKGLTGIDLGHFLIKRVVSLLQSEFPSLAIFSTLSPVPGFRAWLEQRCTAATLSSSSQLFKENETNAILRLQATTGSCTSESPALLHQQAAAILLRLIQSKNNSAAVVESLRTMLTRLCAHYLAVQKRRNLALDPVANFHLRNGAELHRICWAADLTEKGWNQSLNFMVNYLYDLPKIEANNQAYILESKVSTSPLVSALLVD